MDTMTITTTGVADKKLDNGHEGIDPRTIKWLRILPRSIWPYDMVYDVRTPGVTHTVTEDHFWALLDAVDEDDALIVYEDARIRGRSWTVKVIAELEAQHAQNVADGFTLEGSRAERQHTQRRSPITGHFIGGDRGAK